jgi:epoxyqueuosine reductase
MRTLNKTIKAEVERLGFSFLHITQPIQPPHYQAYLRWLTDSSAGEMGYLSTDKTRLSRGNPAGLLENARSMLTFGVRYSQLTQNPLTQQNPQRPVGLIASYALHNDYHGLLKQAAQRLMDLVKRETTCDVHYRVFVDSSALLEKDSAFMAGAGWIGKNSLLITPEGGSFQVLGCILTDLDLPAEPAFSKDLCGTCQKCQISCPTGCISAEHTLRADECIAYLTIEHKGVIPRGMRAKMGNWVFGCDVCQNVCPWNKKIPAVETAAPILPIWQSNPQIDLLAEIQLGPQEFQTKYTGSAILRATHVGFQRNLIIAMGNSASIACLPVLKEILTSNADGLLRLHAAWAIAALEPPNKRQILETALAAENDERVREELCIGLSQE